MHQLRVDSAERTFKMAERVYACTEYVNPADDRLHASQAAGASHCLTFTYIQVVIFGSTLSFLLHIKVKET